MMLLPHQPSGLLAPRGQEAARAALYACACMCATVCTCASCLQPRASLPALPSSLQGRWPLAMPLAANRASRACVALAARSQSTPCDSGARQAVPELQRAPHAAGLAAREGVPHVQNDATGDAALSGGATMGSMTGWQALADQARLRARAPCRG